VDFRVVIEGIDEDDLRIVYDHKGDDLRIDVDVKDRLFRGRGHRIRFIITVPEQYDLKLDTSGGSISIRDVTGSIDAETSGGSLSFRSVSGDVNGRTSGGSVSATLIDGEVDLHTSGGSINVTDVTSHLTARTSGGTIKVEHVEGDATLHTSGGSISLREIKGRVEASTSGGTVRSVISEPPGGDIYLSTSGGSIKVSLASGIGMSVRARGNRIYSDYPVNGLTKAKGRLVGDIHGGGPILSLKSSGGGSINIRSD
jgi:DUF4097 and DUF4098 domain-containing protein YvlB